MRSVSLGFGGPALLDSVDLRIEPGERVCLVGRNGTGKTTVLKMIMGQVEPDTGEIERGVGVRVASLAQEVPEGVAGTVSQVVSAGLINYGSGHPERGHEVESVLSRLELDGAEEFSTLSGGMKRRVMLAKALVSEPDLLLLDEPTNHLDINSITWLEQFLSRFEGALLFVTHDRMFLRKLATRIVEIDRGRLTSWPGNYDKYVEEKQAALEVEAKQNDKFDKLLAQEEVWIRQGILARRTRNEGRVRSLMKLRDEARARRSGEGRVKIELQKGQRTAKKVIEADGLGFGYGEEDIVSGFTGTIFRGEKIGVIGPNGSGKTTLLKLLLGQLEPRDGRIERSDNLQVAYLDQLRDQLDDQKTVAENVLSSGDKVIINGRPKHIIGYLKDFLFSGERARTPVWVLSGGERNRLLLARLFTNPSNVLVLDEPTNDLDTETLELLEERVMEYPGTVLVVSHDRTFLNNVVTGTLVFEGDGKVKDFVGGYDDWVRQSTDDQPIKKKQKSSAEEHKRRKQAQKRRILTYKEKLELEQLPAKIEQLESEQEELHATMADPDFYKIAGEKVATTQTRLEQLEADLAILYERWESLEALPKK